MRFRWTSIPQFLIYVSPYLGVLGILAVDFWCHDALMPEHLKIDFLDLPKIGRSDAPLARIAQYSSTRLWITSMSVHLAVCIAAMLATSVRVHNYFEGSKKRLWHLSLAFLFTVIPAVCYVLFLVKRGKGSDDSVGYIEIARVVELMGGSIFSGIAAKVALFDAVGLATGILFATVASIIVWPIVEPHWNIAQKAARLSFKMQLLRFLLYFGMIVLVTNVVQVKALVGIVLGTIQSAPSPGEEKALTDAIREITTALATARGALGTMLLAALYLPASFFLREEAYKLAGEAAPESTASDHHEWLQKQDLVASGFALIPRFGAILAPLLAAPIADLSEYFN